MSWATARKRASDFATKWPVQPDKPYSRMTSPQLDDFFEQNGDYQGVDMTVVADVDRARNRLINAINTTAESRRWRTIASGFCVRVIDRPTAGPTVWEVHPLDVAASHMLVELADRNITTVINRTLKIDRKYDGVDQARLKNHEKKALNDERTEMHQGAQLAVDAMRAASNGVVRTQKRLAKVDPNNRLLK